MRDSNEDKTPDYINDPDYLNIVDATDRLASGTSTKTNGKITNVNLAKEAGISKATLYRRFEDFPDLRTTFIALRKNGRPAEDHSLETEEDSRQATQREIKTLRADKKDLCKQLKVKTMQIGLLWLKIKSLEERLKESPPSEGNVTPLFQHPKK